MESVTKTLLSIFRLLVLKPFDHLLFGGCGVLTTPMDEWIKRKQDTPSLSPVAAVNQDALGDSEGWFNTNLPGVYDYADGSSFFGDADH